MHPTGGGLCRAPYRRLTLDEHLCVFLSGPCAELRYIRGPDRLATEADLNEVRSVTSGDISDALDLLGGDTAALWVHWQHSGGFVGRHWDGITLLAKVLRHYGQLDGEPVEERRGTAGKRHRQEGDLIRLKHAVIRARFVAWECNLVCPPSDPGPFR